MDILTKLLACVADLGLALHGLPIDTMPARSRARPDAGPSPGPNIRPNIRPNTRPSTRSSTRSGKFPAAAGADGTTRMRERD